MRLGTEYGRQAEAKARGYESSEECGECGNLTLVRNGTHLKCDTCGTESGKTNKTGATFGEALRLIGLPSEVKDIIGRVFVFADGDHSVVGTIISLGYGAEEGFSIYVSPPRFRGISIKNLQRKDKQSKWIAVSPEGEQRSGLLILL
jgi:hypothetical protein